MNTLTSLALALEISKPQLVKLLRITGGHQELRSTFIAAMNQTASNGRVVGEDLQPINPMLDQNKQPIAAEDGTPHYPEEVVTVIR